MSRGEITIIPLSEVIKLKELLSTQKVNSDNLRIIKRFDSSSDIKQVLYNREPSLLLNKAVIFREDRGENNHLRVLSQTEITNKHCDGHYPSYPIFPIAQIAEIIGQTGCLLLSVVKNDDFKDAVPLAVKSKEFRSGNSGFITPGDTLVTLAEILHSKANFAQIKATVITREEIVATMDVLSYMAVKLPAKRTLTD